jgi:Plasmid replication protein.
MSEKKSNATNRARNFATVVYPESAPKNWVEILTEHFTPAFISPLHDKDVDPDGVIKKEHYHVVIMYDSMKTNDQAKEIFEAIGGVGMERIATLRGYARYLCHLDNPEKYQYPQEEIKSLCGADYISIIGLSSDKYTAIGEMIDYCEDNNITSYSELLKYARGNRQDWFRVLCDSGTLVMREYLKSKTWTEDKGK